MKPNQLLTSLLVATAMFVASCSTPQMAQNVAVGDDVYNTTAQARVYKPAPVYERRYNDTTNNDSYSTSDSEYDMDYASRIDRFYYGNPNRAYYDPYYNYYGYNSFYDPFGYSLGGYFGYSWNNWNNPYNNWGFYGSPYRNGFWGPYSYYGGGWGNGFYGGGWGGGFGGGYYAGKNENYRPRPTRGTENGYNRNQARPSGTYSVPARGNTGSNSFGRPSRAENYNPTNGQATSGRPTRGSEGNTRPTQTQSRPSRGDSYSPPATQNYTPPTRSYTPPPSNNSGGSGSSGGGNSGGGGGSRPTRSGGRG